MKTNKWIETIPEIGSILLYNDTLFVRSNNILDADTYINIPMNLWLSQTRDTIYVTDYKNREACIFNWQTKQFDNKKKGVKLIYASYTDKDSFLYIGYESYPMISTEINGEVIQRGEVPGSAYFAKTIFYKDLLVANCSKSIYRYDINHINVLMEYIHLLEYDKLEKDSNGKYFLTPVKEPWYSIINSRYNLILVDNLLNFYAAEEECTPKTYNVDTVFGAIDIETGELVWEENKKLIVARHLHPENKHLYAYGEMDGKIYFQILDPLNGTLLVDNPMEQYTVEGIRPILNLNTLDGKYLWFVANEGAESAFGKLNTETLEIESYTKYPLEKDNRFFTAPIIHQGKIYIRDLIQNMYVFED